MTNATLTLTDFLLARIAEDEGVARDQWSRGWSTMYGQSVWDREEHEYGYSLIAECPGSGTAGTHIARHDPARVLAECEAKRRIVAECSEVMTPAQEWTSADSDYTLASYTLRALATPYADHPDYRDGWRP